MKRHRSVSLALAAIAVLTVVFAACGDDDDEPTATASPAATMNATRTPSPSPTATPAPTASPTPAPNPQLSRRNAETVLFAVTERSYDDLMSLVRYVSMPCIDAPQGAGAPPVCSQAGVPSGSMVEVFPVAFCQGEYVPRQNVRPLLQQRIESDNPEYYGVLKVSRHPLPPPGVDERSPDYAVVFRSRTNPGDYLAFHLRDGGIVALQMMGDTCGPPVPPPADPAWDTRPQT